MPGISSDTNLIAKWSKAVTVPLRPGNSVRYLIDGWATFEAMYDAIETTLGSEESPNYYIYLLGWWLDEDVPLKTGATIRCLFAEAANRKVQIRVMLWDQAGHKNSKEIAHVDAWPTGAGILDNRTAWKETGAHHQKVLIVKGSRGLIGFCGGVDINKDRIQQTEKPKGAPMHDVHCQIEGDAVNDLVDVFVQRWLAHPKHEEKDRKGHLLGLTDRRPPSEVSQRGSQFVGIARTFNRLLPYGGRCAEEQTIRTTMIGIIRAAQQFIYIEDQYLVNREAAIELRKALPRIKHLTILIPHSSISDFPCVWDARLRFLDVLLNDMSKKDQRKVNIFYRVTPGPTRFGPHTYVHAKTWIVDDELAVIGSANCNERGWISDSEVCAAIGDTAPSKTECISFAQKLRTKLWAEHLADGRDNIKEGDLVDGELSAQLWLKVANDPTSKIRLYNRFEGRDSPLNITNWAPSPSVDPGKGKTNPLKSCSGINALDRRQRSSP